MTSTRGHRRIGQRGALLAVVIFAGSGCAKIIGVDLDKPIQPSGGGASSGGAGGAGGATSSGATGGETNPTTSTGTSSETGSTTSTGSGGVDCMMTETCATKTVFMGADATNPADCKKKLTNGLMSNVKSDLTTAGFTPLTAFLVFAMPLPNTKPLTVCTAPASGEHVATIGGAFPCTIGDAGTKILGYVSTVQARSDYEQLHELSSNGFIAIVTQNTIYPNVCCHAAQSCDLVPYYIPTK